MTALGLRWVLSGGIGSGKSSVRRLLASGGWHAVDADSVGHDVLVGPGFDAVAARWPEVAEEGRIDRAALARIVFDDPDALAELESITHPYIFGSIQGQLEGIEGPAVVEVPLIEHGLGSGYKRMVVDSATGVRVERLLERGMPQEQIDSRMSAQPSRAGWLSAADLVIPNHGSLEELEETVGRVLAAIP